MSQRKIAILSIVAAWFVVVLAILLGVFLAKGMMVLVIFTAINAFAITLVWARKFNSSRAVKVNLLISQTSISSAFITGPASSGMRECGTPSIVITCPSVALSGRTMRSAVETMETTSTPSGMVASWKPLPRR